MLWPKHLITKLKKIKESFCDRAGLSTVNGACFTNGFIPKCSFIIYPRAESDCWYSGERCTVQMPGCALNSAGCCFFFSSFRGIPHEKHFSFVKTKRNENNKLNNINMQDILCSSLLHEKTRESWKMMVQCAQRERLRVSPLCGLLYFVFSRSLLLHFP